MASSINASVSGAGGVITTADNTGTLQLQSGGTTIATISSTGITTQVGAPTFSAYFNGSLTLTSAYTAYKITCETEQWDTNSNYDNSTNYRFTPTVAGYYQVNGGVSITTGSNTIRSFLYKNGSMYCCGNPATNSSIGRIPSQISMIVYLNGSTDYIELYGDSPSASQTVAAYSVDNKLSTYFNAALIRSA
jgi:hypothetical protein